MPLYQTKYILQDLNECIVNKKPFSIIRYGDAIHGIVASFLLPGLIDGGKWKGSRGLKMSNSILGQLTIPSSIRKEMVLKVVRAADNSNYCDSFEAYSLLNTKKGVGIIGEKCIDIHTAVGITNSNYCSPFIHYFSIVNNELNLFDLMKGRKIFCISNQLHIINRLKIQSGANLIDGYKVPRRGRSQNHYKDHYKKVIELIRQTANNFDLFLIGCGFLGKLYCDEVKRSGGRAFDSGRLFDFWSGVRKIDSRPKRFLRYDSVNMLCKRIRKDGSGLW